MNANENKTDEKIWLPQTPSATAAKFCNLIESGQPLAIHFWAQWDAHDKEVDKTLAAIAPRLAGWVDLYSCDIEDQANHQWCSELDIYAIPCVIVFAGGAARHRIVGMRDEMTMARDILIGLTTDALQEGPWWKFW